MKFPYFTTIGVSIGYFNYYLITKEIKGDLGTTLGVGVGLLMTTTGAIIDILIISLT